MIWLTWRQFRIQAAAGYLAVAAFTVVLAVTGPQLPDLGGVGSSVYDQLTRSDRNLYYAGLVVMIVAPALIGAFWGAPLVARELEAGTHRLAWNQSITRNRWLAAKLGVCAAAAAAAIGVLALAVTWWASALDGSTSSTRGSLPARLTPVAFAMRGVVPVGYAVFALVLGVTAGVVLRRTVPAMAVTLAVFVAVQLAVPQWVRPHLLPATERTFTISQSNLMSLELPGPGQPVRISVDTGNRGDWILSNQTVDPAGREVTALPQWVGDCLAAEPPPRPTTTSAAIAPAVGSCFGRLAQLGYRQRVVYQPADRFWPLQWAETALFLALSGLVSWFSFWWTRRRLA